MKRITVAFLVSLAVVSVSYGGEQYGYNPALNPVKFLESPKHEPLELVKDGKVNFALAFDQQVETDKDLHPLRKSVRHGVEALQEAIKKCTGLDAPVIDANSAEDAGKYKYLILVGKSVLTDKLGLKPMELPAQGFEVVTFAGGVAIAGYDGSLRPEGYDKHDWIRIRQNGTANGVEDFIERFLGARFYFPGPGVVWPEVKELTIRPVHYSDTPVFKNHSSYVFASKGTHNYGDTRKINDKDEQWPAAWKDYPEDWREFEWRWRIARGSQFDVTHSPMPQRWLELHPDKKEMMFYRDPSGAQYYNPLQHIGNYFDVSNLELADLYVADCKKYYESGDDALFKNWHHPNSVYIPFGQCDTFVSNMDTPTIRELGLIPESRRGVVHDNRGGELSDVYSRFHIAMAEKIKKEMPGKRLAIIPYHNYALPPVNPKYRNFPDNIDLRVCIGDFPIYVTNPEKAEYWKNQLKDWYEVLGNRPVVSMWLYNTYTFPWGKAVVGRHVGEIPKKMGKYFGREGMYFDAGGLEWYYYPSFYCAYRAMWNPDFNVQAAMDESWPLLYGKAAPFLQEFDGILVDRWVKVFAQKGITSDVYKEALPLPLLDKLDDLLKKAEAALEPDSVEMLRFKLYSHPWPDAIKRMRGSIVFKKPMYKVKRLAEGETITVDGRLDEPVWQNANVIPLQDPFGGGDAKKAFTGRAVWNNEGIYLSYVMTGKPLADPKQGMFKNDNVEMFFSPGTDLNNYFQFVVSSVAATWTGTKTLKPVPTVYDQNWKCQGFLSAVETRDDGWSFEIFVPFAGLGEKAPQPYANWFMNIVGNKISEPAEYSAYSLTQGNNHNIELYGYLHFLGKGD